jgi:hypothetical protein
MSEYSFRVNGFFNLDELVVRDRAVVELCSLSRAKFWVDIVEIGLKFAVGLSVG